MSQTLPERRSGASAERWEPLGELERATERMRRLLDQTLGGVGLPALAEAAMWSPPVDIEERDDAYVIEAELPGVDRKDISIDLVGNELTISGEIKEKEREGILRRRTRRVGRFEYRVMLPDQVDPENVEAKLHDGVLTMQAPKSQRAQRRRVEVKTS
jgi:HSP20 family protein